MCGEIQAHTNSPKSLKGNSTPIEREPSQNFVKAIQWAPPEMEDSGQETIDEHWEVNLRATDDPKRSFMSAMMSDEEVAQYEQLLHECKDVFAYEYQDMLGLDPNVVVHKLTTS